VREQIPFSAVANQKSKRRSRKPRAGRRTAPRAVASSRREQRAERAAQEQRTTAFADRTLGTVGERPVSPFGGLPVSEVAIFAGIVGLVVGLITGGEAAMLVGAVVCGLGVTEVTAREHFTGYRSHAMLLAAIPAVVVEVIVVFTIGPPAQRGLLALLALAVWLPGFWLLRRTFRTARHARVARPPAP